MSGVDTITERVMMQRRIRQLLFRAFLGVILTGALALPAKAGAPLNIPELNDYDNASMMVADTIRPSVVLIEVSVPRPSDQPGLPSRTRRATAQGSGVIIDPAGFILTNDHLVADSNKTTVYLLGGASYPATVVGTDAIRDLAVIRINPARPLTTAVLGNADVERPGSWVMAVGFPFGNELDVAQTYEPSIAVGIISATGREIESDVQGQSFRGLLQTDAAINPGNSGGPLVNSHAEVIAINQAIYTPSLVNANVGVGFAIPINTRSKEIIRTLMAGGTVVRGQLGVAVAPLTDAVRQKQGVATGVTVAQVSSGGPAGRAGLKTGDVIVKYGSQDITNPGQLVDLVQATAPGTRVPLQVIRDKKPITIEVTVGRLTAEADAGIALPIGDFSTA